MNVRDGMEDRVMSEWQPIETAPKDGNILLADAESVEIGFWNHSVAEWMDAGLRGYLDPTWPTHWMPLPAPPIAALRAHQSMAGGEV